MMENAQEVHAGTFKGHVVRLHGNVFPCDNIILKCVYECCRVLLTSNK